MGPLLKTNKMIRFVYDLDIVLEAMQNEDYEDAARMIEDIKEDLRILALL
jgi:hypothetical protein|tara:strand:- start:211 stop:360 length:150 start_codon:yes stop_codon:yes gene_type:complete